ncbi:DNA topoisomerase VI subunit B [Candidatus Micrarchaeota archaeon]|nr:DNA topoisomerase VI subunit B [Candidatus Micrarchaeota archaeon]
MVEEKKGEKAAAVVQKLVEKTPTLEELEKEFKEYSVAEFFKKNRQMLGYTGKVRSLTTIVHEAVTNSVTWDTPTVMQGEKGVEINPIGKIVDETMEKNPVDYSEKQEVESCRDFKKFSVLCFDKNTLSLKFKQVKSVHRHKMNTGEKIYELNLVGGRSVKVTRHHSLFTLEEGRVKPVLAEELSVGNVVIVPRTPWAGLNQLEELNLIELALELNDEELKDFSVYGVKKLLYNNRDILDEIKSQLSPRDRHYTFYSYYMSRDRLPITLLRILSKEKRKLFYNCLVGIRNSRHKLPAVLPVSRELMQAIGLYVAEGNTRKSLYSISLSFGSHEDLLIEFTKKIFERIFGFSPSSKPAHSTAVNITLHSSTVAFLFAKLLGCGFNAREKKVPWIVFNVSQDLAKDFLFAYLAGDGYPSEKLFSALLTGNYCVSGKITLATASKELSVTMQYLFSSLGYTYSYQEKPAESRILFGAQANFGKSYVIEFYTKQKNSLINYYPLEPGVGEITDSRLKYALQKRNQKYVTFEKISSLHKQNSAKISLEALAFSNSGLGILQISSINEHDATGEYVYDYSVEEDENFVGGFGAICLHNSMDACEDAHILPEITVEIQELPEEHYKVIVEDNGTGVPKKSVGHAFGQLLAGTKFHQRAQKRGQQGIGISYAVLFSQITTGKQSHIKTSTGHDYKVYECDISIDVNKNEPVVRNEKEYSGKFKGVRFESEFTEVTYNRSEYSVYEYLRRTALANPHAQITLVEPTKEIIVFPRASKDLPHKPKKILPHPLGITTSDLIDMSRVTEARKLSSFLTTDFSRFSSDKVREMQELCPGIDLNRAPKNLQWIEAEAIVKAIQKLKWIAPEMDALVPIGEKQIEKSLKNMLAPDCMKVVVRKPRVFRGGIPFMVEAAIAYGGKAGVEGNGESTKRAEVLRFANRVPLLFDAGNCAITEAVKTIDWGRYDLNKVEEQPVSIFVNFVSVYVPYTGAGKLAISAEEEIVAEIRYALMECAREISQYLHGLQKIDEQEKRRTLFYRYIDEVASAIHKLTGKSKEELVRKLKKMAEERTAVEITPEEQEADNVLDKLEKTLEKNGSED